MPNPAFIPALLAAYKAGRFATKKASTKSKTPTRAKQSEVSLEKEIKGDNFTMKESTPAKSDYTATININKSTRENAQIHPTKEIRADLKALQQKHPEMFSKPSDAYKTIQKLKEPTHFYQNPSNPNISMMGKMLDDNKLGRIGIKKDYADDTLKLTHANKISNGEKMNNKLLNRGDTYPLVERATSTLPTLHKKYDRGTPTGANALSKDTKQNPTPKNKTSQEKLPTQRE